MTAIRTISIVVFIALASLSQAREPAELQEAKKTYENGPQNEANRVIYVTKLIQMREKFAEAGNKAWQAVDAEIMRHPAPPDAAAYSRVMAGKWRSPRHDYLYRTDGTWSMLPVEPDATNGKWHFEGNVCVETNVTGTSRYTTLLLDAENYVCTDGKVVFYRQRIR